MFSGSRAAQRQKANDISYQAVNVDHETLAARDTPSANLPAVGHSENSSTTSLKTGTPGNAQLLKSASPLKWLGDGILILFPIPFIVLAIAAYRLDGEPLSHHGHIVQRAMQLGPSIYPLVFAALGGRCLRNIAVRVAERGTTIGILERLLGSQGLVSAIWSIITLRSIDILSILLLLLWGLSPIGGQSSLRLLHESDQTITGASQVYYANPDAPTGLFGVSALQAVPLANTVLSAGLSSSQSSKDGSVDLWNHAKIPRLAEVEDASDTQGSATWHPVRPGSDLVYSSWVGVNIQGISASLNTSFELPYSYLTLNCEAVMRSVQEDAVISYLTQPDKLVMPSAAMSATDNLSSTQPQLFFPDVYLQGQPSPVSTSCFLKSMGPMPPNGSNANMDTTSPPPPPPQLVYGTLNVNTSITVYACNISVIDIEATINCTGLTCIATRLRRSFVDRQIGHTNLTYEPYTKVLRSLQDTESLERNYFLLYYPTVAGNAFDMNGATPMDNYIFGIDDVLDPSGPYDKYARNWSSVPDSKVSERLGMVLNAYWQATSWAGQVVRTTPGVVPNLTAERWADANMNSTNATTTSNITIYRVNHTWITLLILITTILLLLGVVNLYISLSTVAPDIFNYAASLTRENPYAHVPADAARSSVDGTAQARRLLKMKVQVADVKVQGNVGHIALRTVKSRAEFAEGKIRVGRLYD